MPTLVLARIAFEARHGATESERRTLRPFEVDIEIETPLDKAAASDDLADTIDYREVAEIIVALGTGETHHLLESLAPSSPGPSSASSCASSTRPAAPAALSTPPSA
jgi:dihydroneopterin aldolase